MGKERGHMMAGVMVLVAIMGVMSAVAVQDYSEVLRRDNEAEMIFRAEEITRAIQRYRKDHGNQPPTELELLMEPGTRGQYYLRRMYEDPLVKDGKWGLLFVGPGNTIIDPNLEQVDPLTGAVSGTSGAAGATGAQGGLSGLGGLGNSQRPLGSRKAGGRRGSLLNNSSTTGQQTGLPIAGVRTLSEDAPFRIRNGLTEYEQWQFTYFDLENAQIPGQRNLRQPNRGSGLGGLGNQGGPRGLSGGQNPGGNRPAPGSGGNRPRR